jgi:hypothetical protein
MSFRTTWLGVALTWEKHDWGKNGEKLTRGLRRINTRNYVFAFVTDVTAKLIMSVFV